HASEIFEHHVRRCAALQRGERLHVSAAAGARLNLTWGSAPNPGSVARGDPRAPLRSLAGALCAPRISRANLRDEGHQLVVIDRLAVRTAQRSRVPLRAASSATIRAGTLDAANLGK